LKFDTYTVKTVNGVQESILLAVVVPGN